MAADEKTILEGKIANGRARLEKLRRKNREIEIKIIMCDIIDGRKNLDDVPTDLMNEFYMAVEKRIQELRYMDSSSKST
uniref:No apical meristem-associated C-terminal domain-containing protein n=1 Tax=Leersia perrieri TaxID=77586 RepID=A0A0D9XS97_9ORYZ